MPKTVIEKSPSPSSDVTVFSVSGTLGFHEKDTLEKLFDECRKRSITRVVLDLSKLTSLGGGCAKILQTVAAAGEIALGVTGAKPTVMKFLKDAEHLLPLWHHSSQPELTVVNQKKRRLRYETDVRAFVELPEERVPFMILQYAGKPEFA